MVRRLQSNRCSLSLVISTVIASLEHRTMMADEHGRWKHSHWRHSCATLVDIFACVDTFGTRSTPKQLHEQMNEWFMNERMFVERASAKKKKKNPCSLIVFMTHKKLKENKTNKSILKLNLTYIHCEKNRKQILGVLISGTKYSFIASLGGGGGKGGGGSVSSLLLYGGSGLLSGRLFNTSALIPPPQKKKKKSLSNARWMIHSSTHAFPSSF